MKRGEQDGIGGTIRSGWWGVAFGLGLALWLAGCGGGSSGPGAPGPVAPGAAEPAAPAPSTPTTSTTATPTENLPATGACSLPEQHAWMRSNVRDNYLWADITPDRDPAGYTSLASYFRALLFAGNENMPADRYSSYSSATSFARFYGEGKTMGYGVAVAGQEVRGMPWAPLYVRYVEPASPAAAAGVRRGQRVLAMNGRPTPEIIAADDFSALSAANEGDVVRLEVEDAGMVRTIAVAAGVYDLTPARLGQVVRSSQGRAVGYLFVQNMVSQTEAELAAAFGRFRSAGVSAVVLDLRYNGGGLVSVGGRLASYTAGSPADGKLYVRLQYRPQLASRNLNYFFSNPGNWAGVRRVYVLTGMRTCSASEQVIHGLQGAGLEVVTIGSTTCGKPVGFQPRTYCERTFSLVNFESVNATGRGGYYLGLAPTCPVAEDPRQPLGMPTEPLLGAALNHLDGLGCPIPGEDDLRQTLRWRAFNPRAPFVEPDLWQGMIAQ